MTLYFATALLSMFFTGQDDAERMLRLVTADQPLVHSVVVDAPVKKVWEAYTTTSGIISWMVPKGEVALRVGGYLRTSYSKDSKLTGPDVIENTILAFDPERMISIKCTKMPDKFPFKKAMENVWTVLYFKPVGDKKTEVVCRMIGFDGTGESVQMKNFFRQGNQQEFDMLTKYFKSKR
ncbi:MAG: SRPBCC domain-containing protein [Chlorobia bacterium]|nr:SRPBCC domain-containing protein [Fimbriimonadaceae bacterium]